ncbi:MAG: Na+/H+ antiporter subunit E [Candidatus Methanomethylicia archaeon]
MSKLLKVTVLAFIVFIVYMVFSGSTMLFDLLIGIIVAFITSMFVADFLVLNPSKLLSLKRIINLIVYTLYYFTRIEFTAHYDVIRRILNPKMPINPGIVRVPYYSESDYSMVTVANSITNTPGTVVVDFDEVRKVFYVHWIDVKSIDPRDTYSFIARTFEDYARRIFD